MQQNAIKWGWSSKPHIYFAGGCWRCVGRKWIGRFEAHALTPVAAFKKWEPDDRPEWGKH